MKVVDEEQIDHYLKDVEGMIIEEYHIEGYECSAFVLSKEEEKRVHHPYRKGVIVKFLG